MENGMNVVWDRNADMIRYGDKTLTPTRGERALLNILTSRPGGLFGMREVEAVFAAAGPTSISDYRSRLRDKMIASLGLTRDEANALLETVPFQGTRWNGDVAKNPVTITWVGNPFGPAGETMTYDEVQSELVRAQFDRKWLGTTEGKEVALWQRATGEWLLLAVDRKGSPRLLRTGLNGRLA